MSRVELMNRGIRETARRNKINSPSFGAITSTLFLGLLLLLCLGAWAPAQVILPPCSDLEGQWTNPFDWNIISAGEFGHAVHLVTLAPPQLLLWYFETTGSHANTTRTFLWDPANPSNPLEIVNPPLTSNIFCAGQCFLPDGRVVICGGLTQVATCCYTGPFNGCENIKAWIFDPATQTFATPTNMKWSRFYPTIVPTTSSFTYQGVLCHPGTPMAIGGTLDELCDNTDPNNPPAPGPSIGAPPLNQVDGKYTRSYEVFAGLSSWMDTGPTPHGPIDAGLPNGQYWPNYPASMPYFRWYPRAHLLHDAVGPEKIFIAGDTHVPQYLPYPTYTNNPFPNVPFRQPTNVLDQSYKIDVVAGAIAASGTQAFVPPAQGLPSLSCSGGAPQQPLNGYYASSVILHTRATPTAPLVANRVITFGGSHGLWGDPLSGHLPIRQVQEWDNASGAWVGKAPLNQARLFQNAVILPTRQILITGGLTRDDHNKLQGGLPLAFAGAQSYEIYDPGTGPTQCGSIPIACLKPPGARIRGYHSLALLLADGRVFSGGGENNPTGGGPNNRDSCEIYSPGYVFAPRPRIIAAPTTVTYSSSFSVTVRPTAGSLANPLGFRLALIRPGAVTHHFDSEQRYLDLSFTAAPATGNNWTLSVNPVTYPTLAPLGYYMLFFVDAEAPSIASIVKLQ